MKLFVITALFVCFTFYAHAKFSQDVSDTLDPETERLYNFGASLNATKEGWRLANSTMIKKVHYPRDWEFVENFLGTVFLVKSPLSSKTDEFAENVTLTKETVNKADFPISLEKFVAKQIENHQSYFENWTLLTQNSAILKEQSLEILLFTGQKNETTFKIRQYFFIVNKEIYTFSYTAQVDLFDVYEAIANDIFQSLELL